MEKSIEIFTLLTGVVYVILEIRQKNFMWVLGILTSLASMWMFFHNGMYASFGLQVYYFVTAFIGLWQWGRDRGNLDRHDHESKIFLRRLSVGPVLVSAFLTVAGTFALSWAMDCLHAVGLLAENPMSWLDASVAVLSAVATWWLVRSYLEQWWLWIAANALSAVLCMTQEMWWMTGLYVAYVVASVIGLCHWKRNGVYL